MKKIETTFTKYNMTFTQIERKKDYAIFKQIGKNWVTPYYEVIKIGRHNGYKMGGAYIKSAETYPGASLWGIQGWTFTTLEKAKHKFSQLLKRHKSLQYA